MSKSDTSSLPHEHVLVPTLSQHAGSTSVHGDEISSHPYIPSHADSKLDTKPVYTEDAPDSVEKPDQTPTAMRTPIEWSSPRAFGQSFVARLREICTKRFLLCLLAGQIISWCITSTNTVTTELVSHGFNLPTTQTFFT